MRKLSDLLELEAVRDALAVELNTSRRLLPDPTFHNGLLTHVDSVATWIHGSLSAEWHPSREQIVAASKARHGVRPIAVWDLNASVAYRALADRLRPHLSAPERSASAWTSFQREPLEQPGEYVVSADIAACYQMIDHAELAAELITQTGEGTVVGQIIDLLQSVSGRAYGIPQQSAPSDLMAETFLAALERRITRKGLDLTRYNDDFRVNCKSWSDVVRAIEVLSEEARALGLMLNDSKVLTYRRCTYKDRLDKADLLRKEIADEAELDLTQYLLDYDGNVQPIKPEQTDVTDLTAVRVLERWQRVAGRGQLEDGQRAEHIALLQLVPLALREMSKTSTDAPKALDISMDLLRYEQTVTPSVCGYLATREDDVALLKSFDELLDKKVYLTGWQAWWLQGSLARQDFASGDGSQRRSNWLKELFNDADRSPVLRANAARTLARHKLISEEKIMWVYDRSSAVERPTVVEAMALLKPSSRMRDAVTGDSKIHGLVFDWAETLA